MRKELLQARPKLGRPLLKETPINDSNSISRGFWWVQMPLGPMQPMQVPQLSGIHELHVCKSLLKLSNLEFANHHLLWSSISITTRLNSPKNDRKEDPVACGPVPLKSNPSGSPLAPNARWPTTFQTLRQLLSHKVRVKVGYFRTRMTCEAISDEVSWYDVIWY